MKRVRILLAMLTAVVMATSCTTTQNATDDSIDESTTRRVGNRVYVNDPYYGTVVLERDPFTGRYYDVTYGYNRLSSPYYGTWGNRGGYGRYNRVQGNYPGNVQQRPTAEKPSIESRNEARKKILGN